MNQLISTLKLSTRMLTRDWRSGELRVLLIALIIAVTSVTAVGFFIDRVEQGMSEQAAELIAADLVISSSRDFKDKYFLESKKYSLNVAKITHFRSVLLVNDKPQLVEVKAVTDKYPLRGHIRISGSAFGQDVETDLIPAKGEVWIEARLLSLLNLKLGDKISLGKLSLTLKKIIRYEPDRGGDLFSLAPRVMINNSDLKPSGLVQQGSLANYRILFSSNKQSDINKFKQWLEPKLLKTEKLLTTKDGRPELRVALDRAQEFLGLAALISVLLAGVAVATAARRFATRHMDGSAIMRSMGARQSIIIQIFSFEMLWLALISSSIGCILGWFTQLGITQILNKLLLANLPSTTFEPVILGYATGIIMLFGFVLPPLLSLKNVSPLRVLRKDQKIKATPAWLIYLAVLLSMGLLLQWQLRNPMLVVFVIFGMIATLIILAITAALLIKLLNQLRQQVGVSWRFGFANIARRPASSVIQIVSFGLGIMVLLLLSTVRSDLITNWQHSLPSDAANHFLINVQSDQVIELKKSLANIGVSKPKLYPMVRARLIAINNKKISTENYESSRAKHLVTREFNLSWAEKLQKGNIILEGKWWSKFEAGSDQMSIEKGIAKSLKINLNDTVSFDVNGSQHNFIISSIRSVDWDSFEINFFTVVPPEVLNNTPTSWVTSFYLSPQQKNKIGSIVKQFPNVTVLDVDAIMNRVRIIIDRVTYAVEFIFIFSLIAGIAVLFSAIQSYQDERQFENAILRTLGATRKILLRGLVAEFITMGALSGLLAGIAATSIAYVLSEKIFSIEYNFDPTVALFGVFSGIIIVGIAGVMGTYSTITHPPLQTLRES
jgi:putative ABC transport system permease protein